MKDRDILIHAVTEYDRKQEDKARRNPRAYHNHYALGAIPDACRRIMADIQAGAHIDAAIFAGFTPGALRNACLKACGFKATNVESHGNYKGMPVYKPASEK